MCEQYAKVIVAWKMFYTPHVNLSIVLIFHSVLMRLYPLSQIWRWGNNKCGSEWHLRLYKIRFPPLLRCWKWSVPLVYNFVLVRGTMHNTSGTLSSQEKHLELLPAQEQIAVCRMLSPGEIMQTSGRLRLGKYQLCYTTHSKLSPMS